MILRDSVVGKTRGIVRGDRPDFADRSRFDELSDFRGKGREQLLLRFHQKTPLLPGKGEQLPDLFSRIDHRLLADHVFSRVQTFPDRTVMKLIRERQINQVYLLILECITQ